MSSPEDRLPVVEQLTRAILATLQGVRTDLGYQQTLTIQRDDQTGQTPPNDLVGFLWQGEANPIDYETSDLNFIDWAQEYVLLVGVYESTATDYPAQARRNFIVADVHKALMLNRQEGGLCLETTLGDVLPLYDNGAQVGVAITFTCHYVHRIDDPYSRS